MGMKTFSLGILLIAFFIFLSNHSFSSDGSIWVESDGVAYMSEIDTPKEVMERAKRDAQSRAIEKAVGIFIKAHTLVSNSQLAEDLIYASVRGKIEKVEVVSEGWDQKNRNIYRVKLKSLVKPVYQERHEGIDIKLTLSKYELKEGDEVKIFYKANKDCYIYIFSIASDGSVTLLMPNSAMKDNFIKGEKTYTFPDDSSNIKLKAIFLPDYKGDIAEERIKIIATKKKEDLISLGFQEGIFQVYDARSTGMISDLVRKLNLLEPDEWTDATVVYRIKR